MLDGLKALLYHRPKARRCSGVRRHMFLLMVSTLESKQTHTFKQTSADLCEELADWSISSSYWCQVSVLPFNDSKYLHTADEADHTSNLVGEVVSFTFLHNACSAVTGGEAPA